MSERSITFLEPWGQHSWKVKYDGPYENNRIPHVELGSANMGSVKAGDVFPLVNIHATGRQEQGSSQRGAVVWDVVGIINMRNPDRPCQAHFTVYFGPDPHNKVHLMQ